MAVKYRGVGIVRWLAKDGEPGKDGKDYEWVFKRTELNIKPSRPLSEPFTDNFVDTANGWTDDPTGVSEYYKFEWASKRVRIAGEWGSFSEPALWAKWSDDGKDGDPGLPGDDGIIRFASTVFRRSDIRLTSNDKPSGGTYLNPEPNRDLNGNIIWHDGIPEGEEMLWASTRIFASSPVVQSNWSRPILMADSPDFEIIYSSKPGDVTPLPPDEHPLIEPNDTWSSIATINTIWMATSRKRMGEWSDWYVVKVKGETGSRGEDGEPGRVGLPGKDGKDGQDGHSPYVGENGNWWEWSYAIMDYIDTRVKAVGTDGIQGATPYPHGSWAGNIDYTRDKITAPYVEYMGDYYLLTKEGTFTNVLPTNTNVWTKFKNFAFMYTEILLADFAKVGSAIFVGDNMISQHGVDKNGNPSTNYHLYPENFIPNYDTNLRQGYTNYGRNIRIGTENGQSVLSFYDNRGIKMYDLSPSGISEIDAREQSWVKYEVVEVAMTYEQAIGNAANRIKYKESYNQQPVYIYRYFAKMVAGQLQDPNNYNGKYFYSDNTSSGLVNLKVYCMKAKSSDPNDRNLYLPSDGETSENLPKIHPNNEYIDMNNPIAMEELFSFMDGVKSNSYNAYWNV